MCTSDSGAVLHFTWPADALPLTLNRRLTERAPLLLDPNRAGKAVAAAPPPEDTVAFYWQSGRAVMKNLCVYYRCSLNGSELAYGSVSALHPGSSIQIGHCRLLLAQPVSEVDDASDYDQLPEVEQILPNGGSYLNDRRYFNDVILACDSGGDVLKSLEVEYKRFLIWQEQGGADFSAFQAPGETRVKTDDRFEQVREQTRYKTLTECIIDRAYLMEKVWPELEGGDAPEALFIADEPRDLLRLLSPEQTVAKRTFSVPELVFQDLRRPGLDSWY